MISQPKIFYGLSNSSFGTVADIYDKRPLHEVTEGTHISDPSNLLCAYR